MERFGWFQAGGAGGGSLQRGALRVNCIDCLDRTNVVQGWLARKQLERLLAQLGLLAPGTPLPEAFPEARRSSLSLVALLLPRKRRHWLARHLDALWLFLCRLGPARCSVLPAWQWAGLGNACLQVFYCSVEAS